MIFEDQMKAALKESITVIEKTQFYQDIINGKNVKKYYIKYLDYAYHYVTLTSSFTPLAARRMNPKYLRIRKWILEHSSEEMGHELMALNDLKKLGKAENEITSQSPPLGVTCWVSYFHYQVAIANPFNAFGVLYFLEGMATDLAPKLVPKIIDSLDDKEKKAITFFREHGDLDEDHLAEQEAILFKADLDKIQQDSIIKTVQEAAQIKKFMLDQLVLEFNQ